MPIIFAARVMLIARPMHLDLLMENACVVNGTILLLRSPANTAFFSEENRSNHIAISDFEYRWTALALGVLRIDVFEERQSYCGTVNRREALLEQT
jgi:hypothetical protein